MLKSNIQLHQETLILLPLFTDIKRLDTILIKIKSRISFY